MRIEVKTPDKGEVVELNSGATVRDAILKLGENPEIYLAKRGSKLVMEIEELDDGDSIELIKIVSGG